jgi:hypothetical protein
MLIREAVIINMSMVKWFLAFVKPESAGSDCPVSAFGRSESMGQRNADGLGIRDIASLDLL